MTTLERLQEDTLARLKGDPFFADLPVLLRRKGVTENDIAEALATLGAAVVILMPTLAVRLPNVPGPDTTLILTVRAIETPLLALDPSGAGVTAEEMAIAALQLLHHWSPGSGVQILTAGPAAPAVAPAEAPEGSIAYDTSVSASAPLAALRKARKPLITVDPGTGNATVTSSTPGAQIYYTLDGSYPLVGTAPTHLATGTPITPTADELFRCIAVAADWQDSDCAEARLSAPTSFLLTDPDGDRIIFDT